MFIHARKQAKNPALPVDGVLQRECNGCHKEKPLLQPAAASSAPEIVPPIVHEMLGIEPRFGHDFSRVRVHTDVHVAESVWARNALAYTVGHNLVFGERQYTSAANRGQQLIIPELLHIMKKSRGETFGLQRLRSFFPQGNWLEHETNLDRDSARQPDSQIPIQPIIHRSKQTEFKICDPEGQHENKLEPLEDSSSQGPEYLRKGYWEGEDIMHGSERGGSGHLRIEHILPKRAFSKSIPSIVYQAVSSASQSLTEPVRSYFEERLGHNFVDVRIHNGNDAGRAANAIGAAAFTIGNHIVFGRDRYMPKTHIGRRLIAHELAHVVQQKDGSENSSPPDSTFIEESADRAAIRAELGFGRVNIEGRASIGLALSLLDPRSLDSTLDIRTLPGGEVIDEYERIRQWLSENQEDSAQREHLLDVLETDIEPRLVDEYERIRQWLSENQEDSAQREHFLDVLDMLEPILNEFSPSASTGRDEFVAAFNREFPTVFHVFAERASNQEPSAPTRRGRLGEASGEQVPADRLWNLFTPTQREMLMDFHLTRRIPERLFNGDEVGNTNEEMRILISAAILARGIYRPSEGAHYQRLHARMCWHWAQAVYHYAGVTPASGPITQGVMGSFDLFGGIATGSCQEQSEYSTPRVNAENLPPTETPGELGPIHEGTGQYETLQAESADPLEPRRVHRRASMPFERLINELQPGDWIWYYPANPDFGGSHSAIFSHWTDRGGTTEQRVRYHEAICFSQNDQSRGGSEHSVLLGEAFVADQNIYPVTNVTRVRHEPTESRQVTTTTEVPSGQRDRQTSMPSIQTQNENFIMQRARQHHLRIDRQMLADCLRDWLRDQNQNLISSLSERLSDRQQMELRDANRIGGEIGEDIEALVRLNQRLYGLITNVGILERNENQAYDESFIQRQMQAQTRFNEERAQIEREINEIDDELEMIQLQEGSAMSDLRAIDLSPRIQQLQGQLRQVFNRIQHLRSGPELDDLQRQRRELIEGIQNLQSRQQQRVRQAELREIRRGLERLRREAQRLQNQRQRTMERLTTSERNLPYGYLHPGRLSGQDTSRSTGLLRDLDPQPDWDQLLLLPRLNIQWPSG
ncbi:MAG: hypothetical protein A4E49_02352 [Methanosaeta sp. PtaU1.Bin112]|nr:MAG: hypothetical protein A4E49_02352 [Methanosaeta sp. PtaU1.Bin112]